MGEGEIKWEGEWLCDGEKEEGKEKRKLNIEDETAGVRLLKEETGKKKKITG